MSPMQVISKTIDRVTLTKLAKERFGDMVKAVHGPPMHAALAAGRWHTFPLMLQLAHVGSEVSRACNAKDKNDNERLWFALERMLELLDLTIGDPKNRYRLREICRTREVLCDFLVGDNMYHSTAPSLDRYFLQFTVAATH